MNPQENSEHRVFDTTIELRRTQRIVRSTLESDDGRIQGAISQHAAADLLPEKKGKERSIDTECAEPPDPLVAYGWQRLLNITCTIFANDWEENNELFMSQVIKCDFSGLELLGKGTNFIVRKLPGLPARTRTSGYPFSARGTRRTLNVLNGTSKARSIVCKQIRVARWHGQGRRSAAILDDVITELQILNHHPIMMHDNVINFNGVMWECDMDLQVWPVLCLEHANHGTLDAFLDKPYILTFAQKMELCLDVGNGLRALHGCGIIHGDIKPENVFIFSHPELRYTAKLGDFSSSTMNFAGDPPNRKLCLGGYTRLWVAPEYSGPAIFEELRAMDVFSFGMLAWTVVQNGKCVLAALASQMEVPPHGVDDFLKKQKQSSNFIDLVKQAVQLPGYCGDILLEDFTAVLESTLRTPQSRDLDQALNSLRKICRSDRTGERSPLRLIEDFDSKLDGSQNSNFDFKVVKNFPRPLQRQILATKMQRLSATGQKPLGLDLSGYNPTEEAIQLFRMVHESMGADTLGERILHNRALESAIREAMGDDAGPTRGAETQQGQEVAGPGGSWLPRLTKHLEQLIVGSICAGPNSFGPSKYRGYLNHKLATCLELLSEAIEKGEEDILPSSLAVACIVALGRPHWLPEETVIGWLQQAPYGGLLSLLDHLEPADRYSAKLEVLQIAANVEDTLQTVEVNETFNGMKFGSSSAVDRQLLVHELHDPLLRAEKDQPVNEELIPRRLFDIAPFVEKLPELKEQLSHSTSDTINYQDKDGRTPLLMACLYGNVEAARLLLSHGANAALASHTGQSVFHCLSYIDPSLQSEFAEELLKAGADPNSKITLGLRIRGSSTPDFPTVSLMRGTPLHHAILNGSLDSVVALLACGADKLLEDSNYLSPLALAAAAHCPDILDCLIQSTETNVATWMDHYGNSLVFAALDGQWNMVRMHLNTTNYYHYAAKTLKVLQDRGANWDVVSYRYSVPALRFACFSSSSFIVSQLIEMGLGSQINLDQQATIPWPLHQAILRGDEHIFMLLLDNGADIHIRASSTGDTCLHACVKAEFEDHFFLEVLLERGAEIDAGDQNGRTALYEAVVRKQFRTATYLLSRGANLEHRDVLGLTVLGSVLESGDNVLPCLGYLLGPAHPFSRSDFIVGRNNSTVLHAAAGAYKTWRTASETRELFEYLLNKFPYKEHLESQEATSGFTPLMIAVLGNDVEAAKALVEAGASLDTKCLSGLCLRRAEMLTKLVVASSNGLATGLDFDDSHGGRAWRDMMKLLLESSVRPIIEPKARPAVSTEEARRHRVDRFVELIRGSKLQCIGDHLERNGTEVAELPAADDPDQSLLDDIEVPEIVLAEIELHLNEKILECATITKPAGYALSRDNDKYYFVPYLCWVIETETLGTKGSLGEVLKTFPPFPSISLIFCKHIVDSLIVVHEAGFTHGALNMSAVVLRTLTSGQSAIPSLIPQLHNFKWSVSEKSKDAVYRKQGNEFDAPELGQSAGEFRRPFRELLKCDVYSLGMVIVHAVAGARIKDLGSFESNPAYVSSAVAAARSSMIKENYSPSIIKKLLVGLQEMLEPEPAKRTCSLRTIHSAIASTLGDHGEAPDEGLAERRRDRLFRSLAGRMKRFGI